jgi:glutathione synthase/RimK-type ligase-like ATP-grasp enzyme
MMNPRYAKKLRKQYKQAIQKLAEGEMGKYVSKLKKDRDVFLVALVVSHICTTALIVYLLVR